MWKPIKDAPTDGKPFVAINKNTAYSRTVRCGVFTDCHFDSGERGWFDADWQDGENDIDFFATFTHWTELPA